MEVGLDAESYRPDSYPLKDSLAEQRKLSEGLKVQPLKDIIGKEAYECMQQGDGETQVNDSVFKDYFNPKTRNRKYFQQGNTLVVREEIPGKTDKGEENKTYVVAVFEKSDIKGKENPRWAGYNVGPQGNLKQRALKMNFITPDDIRRDGTNYLMVKNLCLVKEGEEAIDLAAPWLAMPTSKNAERRRIGLMKFDANLASEKMATAMVYENSILMQDIQDDDFFWNLRGSLGVEGIPPIPRWLITFMAAAKSTQKPSDLSELTSLKEVTDLDLTNLEGLPEEAKKFVKNGLLAYLPHHVTDQLTKLEQMTWLTLIEDAKLSNPDIENIGVAELIRLERNSIASALWMIRSLRKAGFDLLPGKKATELIKSLDVVLRAFDNNYGKPRDSYHKFNRKDLQKIDEEKFPPIDEADYWEENLVRILGRIYQARAQGTEQLNTALLAAHDVATILLGQPPYFNATKTSAALKFDDIITGMAIREAQIKEGIGDEAHPKEGLVQEIILRLRNELRIVNAVNEPKRPEFYDPFYDPPTIALIQKYLAICE
ncbi:hypothetical protein HY029_05785 [Candidatus Gottesmanbacteria bacterium]|nr:hypothetical protein [Candidatus Gottesmanbacteria bacterium]